MAGTGEFVCVLISGRGEEAEEDKAEPEVEPLAPEVDVGIFSSVRTLQSPLGQSGHSFSPHHRHNQTLETKTSIKWFTHQDCKDMFLLSKWNQSKTYEYAIVRDFGTDYGICCWYTPQLNYTEIDLHTRQNNLLEPDWEFWFEKKVPKVEKYSHPILSLTLGTVQGSKTGKDNGFTMLFDIESFDYSYFNEGSEGLKLALVHHLDMPIMRQKGRDQYQFQQTTITFSLRLQVSTSLPALRIRLPSPPL